MMNSFFDKTYVRRAFIGVVLLVVGIIVLRSIAGGLVSEITQDVRMNISTSTRAALNEHAPAFALNTLSGKTVTIAEYVGTPVVVVFWASWNPLAVDQLAIIDRIAPENFHGTKFVVINVQEELSVVQNFMRRANYQIDTLLDETGATTGNYRALTLPTAYFIDKTGNIRVILRGVLSEKMFLEHIESILK